MRQEYIISCLMPRFGIDGSPSSSYDFFDVEYMNLNLCRGFGTFLHIEIGQRLQPFSFRNDKNIDIL